MKGPLIKSGERAQGRLILLLIRPDKAGTGQERGVPEPTAPVSHSPAQSRQHGWVLMGCLGMGPASPPLPASPTHGAGTVPLALAAPWAGTARQAHAWFPADPSPEVMSCPVAPGEMRSPLASSILRKRRFGHPLRGLPQVPPPKPGCRLNRSGSEGAGYHFVPVHLHARRGKSLSFGTHAALSSWSRQLLPPVIAERGFSASSQDPKRLSHTNGILLAACCFPRSPLPCQLLAQAYF